MISYDWMAINGPADFEKLTNLIPKAHGGGHVISLLRRILNASVAAVLVEYPYVDKDYRSTYYVYYAKKARPFDSSCVRLHLFTKSASFDAKTALLTLPSISTGHYLGCVVLRPTYMQTIVKAVIDPDALHKTETMQVIVAPHKVHLLGHTLSVRGFPFAEQASDVAVCAQTACWGVLRHYSERWSIYREFTLFEVSSMGLSGGVGGLRAARGLSAKEMETILLAAGTYPTIVARGEDADQYVRELMGWLESGFPVIAMLDRSHAVTVIGVTKNIVSPVPAKQSLSSWGEISGLVVMDDGTAPYRVMPVWRTDSTTDEVQDTFEDVSHFIVALPEKLTYPSLSVDRMATKFSSAPPAGFLNLYRQGCAVRYFVTTAAALRRHALANVSSYSQEILDMYMRTELPQFVWVIEFSSADHVTKNQVIYRLVADATASPMEAFPAFFVHSIANALVIDDIPGKRLKRKNFSPVGDVMSRMNGDLVPFGPHVF